MQSISKWAPACIGPYSQCKTANILGRDIADDCTGLYVAGQIGLDPFSMQLVGLGSSSSLRERFVAQLAQALSNVRAILEVEHSSFENVSVARVFVDVASLEQEVALEAREFMCKAIQEQVGPTVPYFVVEVGRGCLPKSAMVEIQVDAQGGSHEVKRRTTEETIEGWRVRRCSFPDSPLQLAFVERKEDQVPGENAHADGLHETLASVCAEAPLARIWGPDVPAATRQKTLHTPARIISASGSDSDWLTAAVVELQFVTSRG